MSSDESEWFPKLCWSDRWRCRVAQSNCVPRPEQVNTLHRASEHLTQSDPAPCPEQVNTLRRASQHLALRKGVLALHPCAAQGGNGLKNSACVFFFRRCHAFGERNAIEAAPRLVSDSRQPLDNLAVKRWDHPSIFSHKDLLDLDDKPLHTKTCEVLVLGWQLLQPQ